MSFRETKELEGVLANFKIKCKCGHVTAFVSKSEKAICKHCGRLIYKNKKLEFMDKMKRIQYKNKKRGI